jgi:hypothetical protein
MGVRVGLDFFNKKIDLGHWKVKKVNKSLVAR